MATASVAVSHHGTLGAGVADTITLTVSYPYIEVVNRATTGAGIWFRLDGSAAVAGAAGTYWVGPGGYVIVPAPKDSDVVSLISATADAYSVIGVPE